MVAVRTVSLVLLATLIGTQPARAEDRWHCSVGERLDTHLSAYLETVLGEPGAPRSGVHLYVSWSQQPGYMAEQQLAWIGIPPEATTLWKPDRYYFGIKGERTDRDGSLYFRSPGSPAILPVSARPVVEWLENFHTTAVTIEEPSLRAKLWAGAEWTVDYSDGRGRALGSAAILLPPQQVVQPLFARLRTELERKVADPAQFCREIPPPTREQLEEAMTH